MKFKVGDRVKIVGEYSNTPDVADGKYGRIQFVDAYDAEMPYYVKLDQKVRGKSCYWATEKDLEEVKDKVDMESIQGWEITITSVGDKTTAKLYALGRVIREVSVTRYYKDDYSTEVAAKEAIKKLFEPQGFTGRAVFVGGDTDGGGFTRGKIYQFTDGHLMDDNGSKRPYDKITTLEGDDWYSRMFIKVVE